MPGRVPALGGKIPPQRTLRDFRRLSPPRLETGIYLIWKKYQVFTKAAERFLEQMRAGPEDERRA